MSIPLKQIARALFLNTIDQVDPDKLITRRIILEKDILLIDDISIRLLQFDRIFLIGFGKASLKMAAAIERILGDRISNGLVITNALTNDSKLTHSEVIVGGHPYPNEGSWKGATQAIELVSRADEKTLVIYLVSGGGSALFERSIDDQISLDDVRKLNQLLVTCGATIREINAIRKHLSAVKGGRLASLAPRSYQISLYISDVNHDELSTIASDPTGPDDTTVDDVYHAIDKYQLISKLPEAIARVIADHKLMETPKSDNDVLLRIKRVLLMDNAEMLAISAGLAVESGWQTDIDFGNNEEYYRAVADRLLFRLKALSDKYPKKSVCLIAGGEVSCPVTGDGIGGRNQEFALYCASKLKDLFPTSDITVLSAGTDGIDGNSDAAGAVVDNSTIAKGNETGLNADEFLSRNDSRNYFARLGDLIVTGATGTNVRDLRLFLLRPIVIE